MSDLHVLAKAHLNVLAAEHALNNAKNERRAIERAVMDLAYKQPQTVVIDRQAVTMTQARPQEAVDYKVSEVVL